MPTRARQKYKRTAQAHGYQFENLLLMIFPL